MADGARDNSWRQCEAAEESIQPVRRSLCSWLVLTIRLAFGNLGLGPRLKVWSPEPSPVGLRLVLEREFSSFRNADSDRFGMRVKWSVGSGFSEVVYGDWFLGAGF